MRIRMKPGQVDVVIVGGGHAGAEAAWAACNLLLPRFEESRGTVGGVALVTMDPSKTGASTATRPRCSGCWARGRT